MSDLVLRVAEQRDCASMQAIYEPIVLDTTISFELVPPTADEIDARRRRVLERFPWIVAERDAQVVGYAYATAFRARPAYEWSAETSVYVDTRHYRSGVARTLYVALLDLLKRQRFRVAWAGIALPNDGSVAFHEALGFAPVGLWERVGFKHDTWCDVGLWRLPLDGDETDAPVPTCTVRELAASDTWPEAVGRPSEWSG